MPREALDAPDDLRKQALSQPAYAALKRRICVRLWAAFGQLRRSRKRISFVCSLDEVLKLQKENRIPISGAKSGAFLVRPNPQLTLSMTLLLNAYCTSPMIACSSWLPSNARATRQSGERRLMYSTPYSLKSKFWSPLV